MAPKGWTNAADLAVQAQDTALRAAAARDKKVQTTTTTKTKSSGGVLGGALGTIGTIAGGMLGGSTGAMIGGTLGGAIGGGIDGGGLGSVTGAAGGLATGFGAGQSGFFDQLGWGKAASSGMKSSAPATTNASSYDFSKNVGTGLGFAKNSRDYNFGW